MCVLASRLRLFAFLIVALLAILAAAPPAMAQFEVTEEDDGGLTVVLNGKLLTRYLVKSGAKPIFWPVIGPYGDAVTRSYPVGEELPGEKKDQILDAALRVFGPDGWRAWMYSQYFSAALAWDQVDDKQASARVYLALPDSGKSLLAGSFTATRCPP